MLPAMRDSAFSERPHGLALMLRWQRVAFVVGFSLVLGLLLGFAWKSSLMSLLLRAVALGLVGLLAFGLFEQWPKRTPGWLARWVLQVAAVAVVMPVTTFLIYAASTKP